MQKFTKSLLFLSLALSQNVFSQSDTSSKTLAGVEVTTGQFMPQSLKNSLYQVRVISAERIALSGATSIQQVLNTQLGLRFSNDNALGVTDVKLNGMSGRNVKILIDGAPALDRFDQRVSLSQIDINSIDHIEIVEGPMSVSYGTDAMAGVINVITKKNYRPGFSATARVQEESAADEYYPFSYRGVHFQNLQLNYKKGDWSFSGGGTHNESNGFGGDAYGRNKGWLPKEQWLGNARIGYRKAGLDIYYRLDGMNEMITDRNAINIDVDAPFARTTDQSFRSERFMHQLQGTYQFNKKLSLSSLVSYTDYRRATETFNKDFIAGTSTLGILDGQQDVSKLNSFTFKNTVQYSLSDKIALQPGIDINHEEATGARIVGSPAINDYAAFVSAECKVSERISLRPGARFIFNSVYDAPPVVPALNTKFILNKDLDLRLSYGYGFRAPALRELYFEFRDANHNIIGNPNLKAESSNSFNGSLAWSVPALKKLGFTAALAGFYNDYKNQITLALKDAVSQEYAYINVDKTKNAGFSLDNSFVYKTLRATLGFNYTGVDAPLEAGTYKDDSANYLWTAEINSNITYEVKKIKTAFGLFYKFTGAKPAYSYENNAAIPGYYITRTDSYQLADFTATTTVNRFLGVTAGVKNIFDVTAVNNNTIISSGAAHSAAGALSVSYGRSYFLGLNLQWNKK